MYYAHRDTSTKVLVIADKDKDHILERELTDHVIIFQHQNPSVSYVLINPLKMCLSLR